jgi:DNA-binding MarR family transcriptional regulator
MKNSVIYQIKKLNQAIFKTTFKNKYDRKTIPTPTQMHIIHYICKHQDETIYQKDLEKLLNLSRATVSEVLKTMEKNDLIERISDDKDTRTKKIILKDKTHKIFLEVKELMSHTEKTMTKNISQEELETFFEITQKMYDNLTIERKNI